MALKKAKGNMYPWVTHLWNPIAGPCPHQCSYCYVKSMCRVKQPAELSLKTPFPPLGKGKTIFVGHLCDMFAEGVPDYFILRVLEHCYEWRSNVYVFQTKNPSRYRAFLNFFPPYILLGTTTETNRETPDISNAPEPIIRLLDMLVLACMMWRMRTSRIFITIEPILDFDVDVLALIISKIKPEFVNIGADSKRHNLLEPSPTKISGLVSALKAAGIEVRLKENLKRLFPW